jgi:hypothetical protein
MSICASLQRIIVQKRCENLVPKSRETNTKIYLLVVVLKGAKRFTDVVALRRVSGLIECSQTKTISICKQTKVVNKTFSRMENQSQSLLVCSCLSIH